MLRSISTLSLQNKRVLIRVDFNVPMNKHSEILDTTRIDHTIPLIKHVLEQGGIPILISHLGRPEGKYQQHLSLKPIQIYLQVLFSHKVFLVDPTNELKMHTALQQAYEEKGIVLMENIRFWKEEEENSESFAKMLANYGDTFINEAFSVSHRKHASVVGIPRFMKEKAMGFLFEKEMTEISRFVKSAKEPEIVILGGAKIDTKIGIIHRLMGRAETFLIGGALAYTLLAAEGREIGHSKADMDKLQTATDILRELRQSGKKVFIPEDVVVELADGSTQELPLERVTKDMTIYDIGSKTTSLFLQEIKKASTLIWNGPLGYIEKEQYREGTHKVLEAIQHSSAETLLGGGDTVTVLDMLRISIDHFTYVSLSGGAMIEYIEHLTLPGIQALES